MSYPLKPSQFIALMKERGIRARKSLGQNFLVDPNFLDAMVRDMKIDGDTVVIEIGTGAGHLTERLAENAAHVWSIEIDPAMHALAREMLGPRDNLTLILGDGADYPKAVAKRVVMVSNLPYSEYSRLLLAMLLAPYDAFFVMVQRDVANKLVHDMGPLPVIVRGFFDVKLMHRAGKRLFHPPPRIESAVVRMVPKSAGRPDARIYENLQTLFRQRRKLLKATLSDLKHVPPQVMKYADRRAEALDVETLIRLAGLL